MQQKYTYGIWGAAAGAVALTIVGFTWGGWSTASGTADAIKVAVVNALIPACVKDVMADPAAVAELKFKRVSDYEDVVRDYRKRAGNLTDLGYQFNRDCGKAIQATMATTTTKS